MIYIYIFNEIYVALLTIYYYRLLGLTDGFNEEMRMLPLEGKDRDTETSYNLTGSGGKRFKKRKV